MRRAVEGPVGDGSQRLSRFDRIERAVHWVNAVLFAVVVLPFTYYPVLRLADDREAMGKHVNAGVIRWLGWIYLVLICVVAVAAVPLMVITHNGQG